MKALRLLPPEAAHRVSIRALATGLGLKIAAPSLPIERFGLTFDNPLGIAAGFDKNGEAIAGLDRLGFGVIEIGSVTPEPQPGNPKPRVFRLANDKAVINRYGFNSQGLEAVRRRLERLEKPRAVLGVNLGKNKATTHAAQDYVRGAEAFAHLADYLVINVSSPNTPGLRSEQDPDRLVPLVQAVRDAAPKTPLLVKIAPDLDEAMLEEMAAALVEAPCDGAIISNTTIARPDSLQGKHRDQAGGLSGLPLFEPSTEVLRKVYVYTKGQLPLVGVGGIHSAASAYAKIRAGASLLQLYTALVYQGSQLVRDILFGLPELLRAEGFDSLDEAIGVEHR